jgi:hypothetical protein
MAIVYASFGVPRIEWLLYMHPLELQGARFLKRCAKNLFVHKNMGHKPCKVLYSHLIQ